MVINELEKFKRLLNQNNVQFKEETNDQTALYIPSKQQTVIKVEHDCKNDKLTVIVSKPGLNKPDILNAQDASRLVDVVFRFMKVSVAFNQLADAYENDHGLK